MVIELAVMIAIGIVLALIGPFGSFAMGGLAARLIYWVPVSIAGYMIFRPMHALSIRMAERLDLPPIAADIASVLIAGVPATFLIAFVGGHDIAKPIDPERFLGVYLQVVVLGAVIQGFFVLLDSRKRDPVAPQPDTRPPFLDRLPPAWADRLVALEMEDHYVRAHGPDGRSELILMRMADAERELVGADGARVHRSWWVMRRAIAKVRREGRALKLDLGDGLLASVARDRVAALRDLGWPI